MVVHHLRLDRDLHDEGDRVAKVRKFELGLDVRRIQRPVGQAGERLPDFRVVEYLMSDMACLL